MIRDLLHGDLFWNEFSRAFTGRTKALNSGTRSPDVRIFEQDDSYCVFFEMPGLTKENLEITLEEDTLKVVGEVKAPEGFEELHPITGLPFGEKFETRLRVTQQIDREKVEGELKDGILKVTLFKSSYTRPRRIEIH